MFHYSRLISKKGFMLIAVISAMVLLFILSNLSLADQNIYYVAMDGSDSSPGTEEQPFKTIKKAANVAKHGDTVYVKEGNYNERVFIKKSGTPSGFITFEAKPGDKVITRGFTIGPTSSKQVRFIRIIGFEITNTLEHSRDKNGFSLNGNNLEIVGNNIHDIQGSGISIYGKASQGNILVKDNNITRFKGTGIFIKGSNWLVENNDVSHGTNIWKGKASGDTDAIRFFGKDHIIRGNYLHDFLKSENNLKPSPHMDAFQTYETTRNILIENNQVVNVQGIWAMLEGNYRGTVAYLTFRNNVFVRSASTGFIFKKILNTKIVNNTFIDYDYWAIDLKDRSTTTTVENNIFFRSVAQSQSPYKFSDEGSKKGFVADCNLAYPVSRTSPPSPFSLEQHHRWGINPAFVDPLNDDYHLLSGSGAIDAANSDHAPGVDKEDNARSDDPNTPNSGYGTYPYYDIGAFEYVPSP